MRRKRGSDPDKPGEPGRAQSGGQGVPAQWEPMPVEPRREGDVDQYGWPNEPVRGSVPPPQYQHQQPQYPPGYYQQQQPPQVHFHAPSAPVQQNVVVHTKGRGCFGTLFQGVGFIVVAIIVILILILIL
jgi:hypothetical protein